MCIVELTFFNKQYLCLKCNVFDLSDERLTSLLTASFLGNLLLIFFFLLFFFLQCYTNFINVQKHFINIYIMVQKRESYSMHQNISRQSRTLIQHDLEKNIHKHESLQYIENMAY